MKRNDLYVAMMVVFVGLGSMIIADNGPKVIAPAEVQKEILFKGVKIIPESIKVKEGEPLKAVLCIENTSSNTVNVELPIEIYEMRSFAESRSGPRPNLIEAKVHKLKIKPAKKEKLNLTVYKKWEAPKDSRESVTIQVTLKTGKDSSTVLAYYNLDVEDGARPDVDLELLINSSTVKTTLVQTQSQSQISK